MDGCNPGVQRRLDVFRHDSKFVTAGPTDPEHCFFLQEDGLKAAVKKLAPQIMHYLRKAVMPNNRPVPEKVKQWTKQYLGEYNIVKHFVDSVLCRADPSRHGVDMVRLTKAFGQFCNDTQQKNPKMRMRILFQASLSDLLVDCPPQN